MKGTRSSTPIWWAKGALPLLLLALSQGCTSRIPVLDRVSGEDPRLSCADLDQEIVQAAIVRDEAIEEGKVQAINDMIGVSPTRAQLVLGGVAVGGSVPETGTPDHVRSHRAANGRIHQLLSYKNERGCPARPTEDPALSDHQVFLRLDDLDRDYGKGRLSRIERLTQRAELFDLIR